jgi:hypothetical protein
MSIERQIRDIRVTKGFGLAQSSCLIEKGYRGLARLGIRCLTMEVTHSSEEDFEFLLNFFL